MRKPLTAVDSAQKKTAQQRTASANCTLLKVMRSNNSTKYQYTVHHSEKHTLYKD